jgi:hypothetical protein
MTETFHFELEKIGDLIAKSEAEFVVLVGDMRAAQKRYFRDRTQSALQESKRLEREVDQKLKSWMVSAST